MLVRSKLFRSTSGLSDEFQKDLSALLALPKEKLEILAEWFSVSYDPKKAIHEEDVLQLASKLESPTGRVLSIAAFLLNQVYVEEDAIENILSDAVEVGKVEGGTREALDRVCEFVRSLSPVGEILAKYRLEKRALSRGATSLEYCSVAPILKFRPKDAVKRYMDLDIEEYSPELGALVPAVLCELQIDTGENRKHLGFQLTGPQLDQLIKIFRGAQKELRILDEIAEQRGRV